MADVLYSLYNMAGVEVAILGTQDWAELIGANDIKILEYSADLKVGRFTIYKSCRLILDCPRIRCLVQ